MIKDSFENYHPILNFLYFAFVLSFSMVLNHPGAQLISFCCACMYSVQTEGKKASLFILKYCLPVLLLTAVLFGTVTGAAANLISVHLPAKGRRRML